MLFFFITFVSLIFFYNSLPLKPLPKWAYEGRLISLWCYKDLSLLPIRNFLKTTLSGHFIQIPSEMSMKKWNPSLKVDDAAREEICLLDLPELVLELIMERLPPDGLRSIAGVCTSLRDRCTSDSLWELHMKRKWGCIIGPDALREWQSHMVSRKETDFLEPSQRRSLRRSLSRLWPFSLIRSHSDNYAKETKSLLPIDSIMSRYLALESGKFWFPAQVYNRENGHVGFMLSCYDAELCYDSPTDTFQARYPPHGRRAAVVENGVIWDRLREPPIVDISPHGLHISDCLNELSPGDHIEIQWRRNKEFPYGWWYGVVGHLESCDGSDNYCSCGESDTVVLEFNQYAPGSRWRQTSVHRRVHREEGNETDGFYGGVRKLYDNDEISMWRRLWPAEMLQ